MTEKGVVSKASLEGKTQNFHLPSFPLGKGLELAENI